MPIEKIFAHASCRNLTQSTVWYEQIFSRAPDARPMTGLVEWHHGDHAGLQLWKDESNAGRGTMTLIVSDLQAERARLSASGLEPPEIHQGDKVQVLQLRDPDANLVVLAQSKNAS
jgi:hypothetical protein